MKTRPIVPAELSLNADGLPYSPLYDDIYHPRAGAFEQARHVFLAGNGLPVRWQARDRFVVLETGFGLGNNFLATWDAWRRDPARCERLVFISIEQSPFTADALRRVHAHSPLSALSEQLISAWPALTCNLHSLRFEEGRVHLLLALGDVNDWLPELVAEVDAFYLDGFAPARNPLMWQAHLLKALGRLAASEATLATWTAASAVRNGLQAAGFEVRKSAGTGGKRDITLARYAPAFVPRRAPSRTGSRSNASGDRHALIIGGGLAGCATAMALAELGWSSTVFDRHGLSAQEASGNPAGLFHGVVHAHDGTHARFYRAAALETERVVTHAVQHFGAVGSAHGLLRLEDGDVATMRALLARLGLPSTYVQALPAAEASALAGSALAQAAWLYPGGGWVAPGDLARAWLAQATDRVRFAGEREVAALHPTEDGWQLLDAQGRVLDQATTVVLANAGDAMRLLGRPSWPVQAVRGQISMLPRALSPASMLTRMPIAGAGYLLPEVDGDILFGASAQAGDMDGTVRDSDHRRNLEQLAALTAAQSLDVSVTALRGRTGWRWTAQDRLPLIGAVPDERDAMNTGGRLDQPRWVPRRPGLYIFSALGSRGITSAALGARTLAALITAAPAPLEASLLDAVDPARFLSRSAKRGRPATT